MADELERFKELHKFYLYVDYRISELAQKLNVSRRTVERWLSGKTRPSKSKLAQIKEYLDEKESSRSAP